MNELKSLLNKVAAEKRDAFELGKYAYVDLLAEIEVALRQQDELDALRQRLAELEAALSAALSLDPNGDIEHLLWQSRKVPTPTEGEGANDAATNPA